MSIEKNKPDQIVTVLRQIGVQIANGKKVPQACKEAGIHTQTTIAGGRSTEDANMGEMTRYIEQANQITTGRASSGQLKTVFVRGSRPSSPELPKNYTVPDRRRSDTLCTTQARMSFLGCWTTAISKVDCGCTTPCMRATRREGRFLLRHWPDLDDERPWMWQEGTNEDSDGDRSLKLKEQIEQGLYPGHAYVLSFVPSTSDKRKKRQDRVLEGVRTGRGGLFVEHSEDRLFEAEKCPLVPYPRSVRDANVEELAERLNERLFEPIEKRLRGVGGIRNTLFEVAQQKVREELQLFRYLYKDCAYEHEEEYRLVILEPRGKTCSKPTYERRTNTRGETIFRHYMTHESLYSKQILGLKSQVILGPTVPHPENVKKTIEELLCRKSISGTTVTFPK